MGKRLPNWLTAALVLAAYFAILLPYGSTPLISHPDERHYAYAGMKMVETGDWLVPVATDNEIRLKKPVLPYWFAAAGFELLGIGVPGFRLFWILAACGVLAFTYALARILGARDRTALLAMLLTAANPLFFRSSLQSIPDMPLTLFMMMAAVGFCRILSDANTPPRYAAWLGWLGIALAILTKGILPLIFAGFVIIFTAIFARARVKALLAPLPILVAIALVASWFLYAVRNHPAEFFAQFFGDQVTQKVSFSPLPVLRQVPSYFATAIVSFFGLPLVLLIAWWRSSPRAPVSSLPFTVKLLLTWIAAVAIMFGFGPFVAGRYLLPVLPIIGVLTVLGFASIPRGEVIFGRASAWILAVVALVQGILLIVAGTIEFQLAPIWEAAIYTVIAAALFAWTILGIRRPMRAAAILPSAIILALGILFVPVARLILPTLAVPVAERLETAPQSPLPALSIQQSPGMYVRLLSGRSEPYREIKDGNIGDACVIVTEDSDLAEKLRQQGFGIEILRGGYHPKLKGFFEALVEGRLAEARRENAHTAYFATCKS